jgi:hypothetical protein
LNETELETVRAKTVDLSAVSQEYGAGPESPAPEQTDTHTETESGEVKGNTTFGELLSWGVSKEAIEQALGLPIGKAGVTVRDYCIENGIEFSTVKDALQRAADQALGNK